MICSLMGFRSSRIRNDFVFGIDAVMLSDFARVKPGEKVLDLGNRNWDLTDFIVRKDQRRAFYRT